LLCDGHQHNAIRKVNEREFLRMPRVYVRTVQCLLRDSRRVSPRMVMYYPLVMTVPVTHSTTRTYVGSVVQSWVPYQRERTEIRRRCYLRTVRYSRYVSTAYVRTYGAPYVVAFAILIRQETQDVRTTVRPFLTIRKRRTNHMPVHIFLNALHALCFPVPCDDRCHTTSRTRCSYVRIHRSCEELLN